MAVVSPLYTKGLPMEHVSAHARIIHPSLTPDQSRSGLHRAATIVNNAYNSEIRKVQGVLAHRRIPAPPVFVPIAYGGTAPGGSCEDVNPVHSLRQEYLDP